MQRVKLHDKEFQVSIPHDEVQKIVKQVADNINNDLSGVEGVVFLSVLNGSFMFTSDLVKNINFNCEVSFVKLSSYQGTSTTGSVSELIGLSSSLKGKCVVVVEDIVDTGITMERILASLRAKGANDIKVATFLQKPDALQRDIQVDYVAMSIPNDFIVGYGLDYDGYGRNLKDIYTVLD